MSAVGILAGCSLAYAAGVRNACRSNGKAFNRDVVAAALADGVPIGGFYRPADVGFEPSQRSRDLLVS